MAKKRPSKTKSAPGKKVDFETAMADVERIVNELESGELGLTEALRQYEEGVRQLQSCHVILNQAEQRVTLLSGFDADGNPVAKPMPERDATVAEDGVRKDALGQETDSQSSMDDSPGLF